MSDPVESPTPARKPKPRKSRKGPPTPPPVEGLERGDTTKIVNSEWDWQDRILSHSINLLEGRKGCGKSSMCATICAHFAGGSPLPGTQAPIPSPVIWCGAEESWQSVILPRLVSAGCHPGLCMRIRMSNADGSPRRLTLPSGTPELVKLIKASGARCLVLDPFGSMADPDIDLKVEQLARYYLERLADALEECRCTGILTRHLRKGNTGDVLDAGMGSVAIGNTARVILRCDKHPTEDTLQVLSVVASNYGARPPSLTYKLKPCGLGVKVDWQGESKLSADVLAEGRGSSADRDECKDAIILLRGMLENGPREAKALISEARVCGVGERTLRKAKAEAGVTSERRSAGGGGDGSWYWCPPADGWKDI